MTCPECKDTGLDEDEFCHHTPSICLPCCHLGEHDHWTPPSRGEAA